MASAPLPLKARYRKVVAIAASVTLHGLVFWALVAPLSTALSAQGQGSNGNSPEGLGLELVPDYSVPEAHRQSLPTEAFRQMSDPAPTDEFGALEPVKPPKSLADIFGQADQDNPRPKSASTAAASGVQTSKLQQEIWKQVEPCWRRLAGEDTVGVTLSASFSPMGNLAGPPTIMRETGVPLNKKQLHSEAVAINALSQCGPYLSAFGQSDIELGFSMQN